MEQNKYNSPSAVYLTTGDARMKAILEETLPSRTRFAFQHQDISDVEEFRSSGVRENFRQWNGRAAAYVRKHRREIEAAAKEFGFEPDVFKAVIFTEEARGGYEHTGYSG